MGDKIFQEIDPRQATAKPVKPKKTHRKPKSKTAFKYEIWAFFWIGRGRAYFMGSTHS
jgi:hypothetical protein